MFKISTEQLKEAIKNTKNSKALGPDNISPLMIKKIGLVYIRIHHKTV